MIHSPLFWLIGLVCICIAVYGGFSKRLDEIAVHTLSPLAAFGLVAGIAAAFDPDTPTLTSITAVVVSISMFTVVAIVFRTKKKIAENLPTPPQEISTEEKINELLKGNRR